MVRVDSAIRAGATWLDRFACVSELSPRPTGWLLLIGLTIILLADFSAAFVTIPQEQQTNPPEFFATMTAAQASKLFLGRIISQLLAVGCIVLLARPVQELTAQLAANAEPRGSANNREQKLPPALGPILPTARDVVLGLVSYLLLVPPVLLLLNLVTMLAKVWRPDLAKNHQAVDLLQRLCAGLETPDGGGCFCSRSCRWWS